jgi:glyoxylase-like metal-dependent hydrolase (beta-lactamase superfamily II)
MIKAVKNISFICVLIVIFVIILSCSNTKKNTSEVVKNDFLIDSLIVKKRIHDKVLLLMFGSDAITAIRTHKGIVVVDAGISMGLTLKYRRIIENEFKSNDFVYVINTHSHPDHYGGNSQFENAKIIGQAEGLKEISEQWSNPEKVKNRISKIVDEYELESKKLKRNTEEWADNFIQKTRYSYSLYDIEMQIPVKQAEISFSDSLQIDMGDVNFEMVYFGACHSNSDILIYVPELKILFTGDLFFKYGRPSISDTSMKDQNNWENSMKWIEKRIPNIETIISGHGELLSIEDLNSFNRNMLDKCLNK